MESVYQKVNMSKKGLVKNIGFWHEEPEFYISVNNAEGGFNWERFYYFAFFRNSLCSYGGNYSKFLRQLAVVISNTSEVKCV